MVGAGQLGSLQAMNWEFDRKLTRRDGRIANFHGVVRAQIATVGSATRMSPASKMRINQVL